MKLYHIANQAEVKANEAISIRFFGQWQRAFFLRVSSERAITVALERFGQPFGEYTIPVSNAYGVMIRS